MKKLIIAILLGLTLMSCSAGIGASVGKGGIRGNVGVTFK